MNTSDLLDQVLAEYLAALDAGFRPDRAAILARHPEIADDLRRFFANQDRIEGLAAPLRPEPIEIDSSLTVDFGSKPSAADSPTQPAPPDGDEPGIGDHIRYFGDYELLDELGRGGMGVVFKARQVSLNRLVALKIIRSAELASEDELRRFQNEAEAVAQLDHPGIVPIIEVGEFGQRKYFSMKLIVGRGLDVVKARYRDDSRAAARLVSTVAKAVHHAHLRGILHRDLKPSNILIDEAGSPHVTDFGLAKRVEGDSGITHSGAIMGTPSYMAPEQASGKRGLVTTASDVYGLGAVLYDLLTGRAPFRGESVLDTLKLVLEREADPIRPQNPAVDRDLETICLKSLEKDPKRRYASAEALAADLDHWLAGEPIAARPISTAQRGWKWVRRHPAVSSLAASLSLALVVGLVGITLLYLRAEAARKLAADNAVAEKKARKEAESSATAALKARGEAETAGKAALAASARAESSLYVNRIKLAQQYWSTGNVAQAERILDACPEPLRNWEWRYMKRLCHPEVFTLSSDGRFTDGVAFSDDGRRMAAFTRNVGGAGAQVWDLATRKPITEVPSTGFDPPRKFTAGAFSHDGTTVALGDSKGLVTLFDASTGKPIRDVGTLEGGVNSLDFSPDGKLLAAARVDSRDGDPLVPALAPRIRSSMKVWKVADNSVVFGLADVGSVTQFSPDGRFLLVFKQNMSLRFIPGQPFSAALWRIADWTEFRALPSINSWSFSREGRRLAIAGRVTGSGERFLKVLDIESGKELFAARPDDLPSDIALSPDGSRLVACRSMRGEFDLWDVEAKTILRTYRGHSHWIKAIAFNPAGSMIVTCSWDNTIRFWDPTTDPIGRRPTNVAPIAHASDAAIRPDGKQMAFVQGESVGGLFNPGASVTLFDPEAGMVTKTIANAHPGGARRVAYSADGKTVASGGRDGKVRVWNAATGEPIGSFSGHEGNIEALALSPDGLWVASSHEPAEVTRWRNGRGPYPPKMPGAVKVWDAKTGAVRRTIDLATTPYQAVFSHDGASLATAQAAFSDAGSVKLWDLATGERRWDAKAEGSETLLFSPDGSTLAAAGGSQGITLLDARTGRALSRLTGQDRGIFGGIAFSPDGRRLATANSTEVKLWDTADGQEILTLPRLPDGKDLKGVAALAFSPDGKRLIAALRDGRVEIWD